MWNLVCCLPVLVTASSLLICHGTPYYLLGDLSKYAYSGWRGGGRLRYTLNWYWNGPWKIAFFSYMYVMLRYLFLFPVFISYCNQIHKMYLNTVLNVIFIYRSYVVFVNYKRTNYIDWNIFRQLYTIEPYCKFFFGLLCIERHICCHKTYNKQ